MYEQPYISPSLRNDPEYVAFLEQRIALLEARMPQTSLMSPSFMKRAFAVLGHYMVASLIIAIPFYILYFVGIAVFVSSIGSLS